MADTTLSADDLSPAMNPQHPAPDFAKETGADQIDQPQEQAAALPHEILKMPTFMALISGAPPALSARIGKGHDDNPAFDVIRKHKGLLQQAGFGFYKSLSGNLGVIYNSLYVHPQDILAADKAGQLQHVAPPADAIHHAIGKSGLANPVLRVNQPPGAPAQQRSITPPQTASGMLPVPSEQATPGPSAGVQNKDQQARLTSLKSGGPLTGPSPGAGRLLNNILKPVV
jgi:hypothetical protein